MTEFQVRGKAREKKEKPSLSKKNFQTCFEEQYTHVISRFM